ncbi:type II toxin-antitoxin system VapC family toxin [Infirmifilum lucidum]|uniref:Type II toxin-antitoxin system VapC family toxin n=1 Tax=Infirmifilum lucidum TaxID=2776706 RepID=A0A7L9FGY9_9CREN|nr:type II toxin-antitoxin system VapC family toxin [Infirmifilum lucidum]QOJ79070.1 type II toxin-antitoxin system VapC family toxin [Infirmifilum lucidum]
MYLLDSSALYPLVLALGEGVLDVAGRVSILTLTPYEVGNAVWKEYRAGGIKRLEPVVELFSSILGEFRRVDPLEYWSSILSLAVRENLSFYDASYLYVSRVLGLVLVSEDSDLKKYPDVISVREFIDRLRAPDEGG